ncbi:hypothetical protein [Flavobacterium microcysteis]|uniref:Uncharacterized protein n=1 Tax=Flavobacterium microcysteis TaxID=2596891 RepID=A0A501QLN4_9FLAO|nr:hypothetical protein [Flavobacterium microcysteis]TPD73404.1 hypothetical protein FJA49_01570 [Flavobacterium microcysteis]
MIPQKSKVEILHEEITKLYSVGIQALYEIDGIGHAALQVLKSFTTTDRKELIEKLSSWSNKDLEFLAFVLHDDFSETYEDNYLLGHIFTLANDALASNLLDQWIIFFFEENTVESIALLDSMLNRIEGLRLNSYLDETTYKYWVEYLTNLKMKQKGL